MLRASCAERSSTICILTIVEKTGGTSRLFVQVSRGKMMKKISLTKFENGKFTNSKNQVIYLHLYLIINYLVIIKRAVSSNLQSAGEIEEFEFDRYDLQNSP